MSTIGSRISTKLIEKNRAPEPVAKNTDEYIGSSSKTSKVFVPQGIIAYVQQDSLSDDKHVPLETLYLDKDNIIHVANCVHQVRRRHGLMVNPKETYAEVSKYMNKFEEDHDFSDSASYGNQLESLDYYNRQTVKNLTKNMLTPRTAELKPDINVFRAKPFGKKIEDWMPEDYQLMDVWEPHEVTLDAYNTRRNRGNKGMNNPHIIGAHRRHYECDNTDGLRMTGEKGPTQTWGYDNKELYDTTDATYSFDYEDYNIQNLPDLLDYEV